MSNDYIDLFMPSQFFKLLRLPEGIDANGFTNNVNIALVRSSFWRRYNVLRDLVFDETLNNNKYDACTLVELVNAYNHLTTPKDLCDLYCANVHTDFSYSVTDIYCGMSSFWQGDYEESSLEAFKGFIDKEIKFLQNYKKDSANIDKRISSEAAVLDVLIDYLEQALQNTVRCNKDALDKEATKIPERDIIVTYVANGDYFEVSSPSHLGGQSLKLNRIPTDTTKRQSIKSLI